MEPSTWPALRAPTMALVTAGWRRVYAMVTSATVRSWRSAIFRSTSTNSRLLLRYGSWKAMLICFRQSDGEWRRWSRRHPGDPIQRRHHRRSPRCQGRRARSRDLSCRVFSSPWPLLIPMRYFDSSACSSSCSRCSALVWRAWVFPQTNGAGTGWRDVTAPRRRR